MSLFEGAETAIADSFVLAGGRSSRMGKDKSLIALQGKTLVEHAIGILRSAGFEPRISGAQIELSSFAPIVPDDRTVPGQGPLSGICSALEQGTARYALFLPVDLPLMPPSLVSYLVHWAGVTRSAITLPSVCGFLETFPVVIDRALAPRLQAHLRSDDRKCLTAFRAAARALSEPFSVVPVEPLLQAGQVYDSLGLPIQSWFLSVNTPKDLLRVEGLLGRRLQIS